MSVRSDAGEKKFCARIVVGGEARGERLGEGEKPEAVFEREEFPGGGLGEGGLLRAEGGGAAALAWKPGLAEGGGFAWLARFDASTP
jgi:hypothetical protein